VSHYDLAIYVKMYLQANRTIMETQIYYHAKIKSSQNPLKETKLLQDIKTLYPNLKFQHKPKYHLSKILT
jgi:hypothetical protein